MPTSMGQLTRQWCPPDTMCMGMARRGTTTETHTRATGVLAVGRARAYSNAVMVTNFRASGPTTSKTAREFVSMATATNMRANGKTDNAMCAQKARIKSAKS